MITKSLKAIVNIMILVSLFLMIACQDKSETGKSDQTTVRNDSQVPEKRNDRKSEIAYTVAALEGAVIIKTEGRKIVYRKKCTCGHVLPGTTTTFLSPGSTYRSSFRCPKCGHMTKVAIMCSRQ